MSPMFHSMAQTQSFTKDDCGSSDYTGSTVPVTIAAGLFTSAISQQDANNKALAYLQETGQDTANLQGTCTQTTFYSQAQEQTFTPSCPEYYEGTPYIYRVVAGTFTSNISQQDANNKALAQIASLGQSTANTQGICTQVLFPNQQQSQAFYKNDCGLGYTVVEQLFNYTIPAGTYFGSTQAIADQLALNNIAANGQAYANAQGTCLGNPSVFTYRMDEYNAPFTDINLYFSTATGGDVVQIFNDEQGLGGSFSDLRIGDTVTAKLVSAAVEYPWPPNSRARMVITNNGVVVFDSGYKTDQSPILLSQFSFTVAYGDQYHIEAVSEPVPCVVTSDFDVVSTGATTATVTANPSSGVAPYTYAWSNGQNTQAATGLTKDVAYIVVITDSVGCSGTFSVTPDVEVLSGLKLELMYFSAQTAVTTDLYYPRMCAIGSHGCNRARFEVFANGVSQGIANLNNAGGTNAADGSIDDHNTPPTYPNYDQANAADRYWGKEITGADAADIAGAGGTVDFTLQWTGIDPAGAHSNACWFRITKTSTQEVILNTCLDAFTSYQFNPYA